MRPRLNWLIGVSFAVSLVAALSYIPVFSRFPVTRDIPWANLFLFLIAGCLLAGGLWRAFARPRQYRGRISGVVVTLFTVAIFTLFCYGVFYVARQIPSAGAALHIGQRAPEFTLADTEGRSVTLSQLRDGHRAVLLIFYRGYW